MATPVASAANRFRRGLDEGFDPFEVFRAVQDHAANAARVHVERLMLEAFVGAEDAAEQRRDVALACVIDADGNRSAAGGFDQRGGLVDRLWTFVR